MANVAEVTDILDTLINRGVLTPEQLEEARNNSHELPVEKYLLQNEIVDPAEMTLALSEYLRMPPITLTHFNPNQDLLTLLPLDTWKRLKAFPVNKTAKSLIVALGDPFDIMAVDELTSACSLSIFPLVAPEKEISELLQRAATTSVPGLDLADVMQTHDGDIEVGHVDASEESLEKTLESAEGAPVIRMVNMLLVEALRIKASDIHIEALERTTRLRYRVDGVLIDRPAPPKSFHNAVISRIKIMSDLDIAERRVPQDGRFKIRALGREVDIRVSILPTVHGEKVVMRTLDKSSLASGLDALGLDEFSLKAMQHGIDQPHGIILVTGPTGSGKTTTLYSCLQDLNKADVNIVTAEDPVEYQLAGINQVHVNAAVGLTFAGVLRSVLRQDPDIILVGEIRDSETADIAVKAALTGHLVLSTLHTNNAAGVVARLTDMEVPPFLLASSLIVAQAQRLYRKLCQTCRKELPPPKQEILTNNHIDINYFNGYTVYGPGGCPKCNNSGFKGRGAVMEVMTIDDDIREAIIRGRTTAEIQTLAIRKGMISLKEAGMRKVREGVTSLAAALEFTGGE